MRIAIAVVLAWGCATSRGVPHGDTRGTTASDERRLAVMREKLQPVDGLVAEGKLDEAMLVLASFTGHERARPEFLAVANPHEARMNAEIEQRIAAKAWGRAYALATLTNSVFRRSAQHVATTGKAWAEELRPAIADAERGGRPATAIVLRAALAAATLDKAEASATLAAVEALRDESRLGVEVPRSASALLRAAIDEHAQFTSRGKRGGERIVMTLGRAAGSTKMSRGRSTARVEQGTRAVPNPARAEIEDRIERAEQELAHRREELAAEQASASRSESSIYTINYQMEVAQGDLDEARRDLAATPATVEHPNVVEVPFDVETHTLTVTRDVTLEVTAPWAADAARQQKTIVAQRSDNANAADKALGVRADPVDLPTAAALEPDLDTATIAWLRPALDKVATRYLRDLATRDPKDGAARAIVLAPASATAADQQALASVPFAARVVHALPSIVRGNTSPFREDPTSQRGAVAATAKPAQAAAPAAKAEATPRTPSSAKPPADPLRAKAGYAWTIAPFEVKNAGRVVLSVAADGTLTANLGKPRVLAIFKPGGVLEDPDGKIVLVVGAAGDIWSPRDRVASGTLSKSALAFQGAGTMTLAQGHVVIASGTRKQVSNAVVSRGAPTPLVFMAAWLATGVFEMRAR